MPARTLEEELRWATNRPLFDVFKRPDDFKEEVGFPILARICLITAPNIWKRDRTGALLAVMREAVARLPDETRPDRCATTWQNIGYVLCGFREDLEPVGDDETSGYDYYVKVARTEAEYSRSPQSFKLVTRELRKQLADILEKLEREVQRTGITIDNPAFTSGGEPSISKSPPPTAFRPVPREPDDVFPTSNPGPLSTKPADRPHQLRRWSTLMAPAIALVLLLAVVVVNRWGGKESSSNAAKPSTSSSPILGFKITTPLQGLQTYSYASEKSVILNAADLRAMNSQTSTNTDERIAWFMSRHYVPTISTQLIVRVTNTTNFPVTILDVQIVKHCQAAPLTGTLFYSPSTGAGNPGKVPIYFDLGSPITIGKYGSLSGPNFFNAPGVPIEVNDWRDFMIEVESGRQYCTFSFKFEAAVTNGPTEWVSFTDPSFAITAANDATAPIHGLTSPAFVPFSSYQVVYAGNAASEQHNGDFIRVNPATYKGVGDPSSFPIPK